MRVDRYSPAFRPAQRHVRTLFLLLAFASASFAQDSRVASMCDPMVWYSTTIDETLWGYPWPRTYQFMPTYASNDLGSESAGEAVRSTIYKFPTLTSTDATRIILEGEKIGGTCWEDRHVSPTTNDTTWVTRVDLGTPYGGSVKVLYNAEAGTGGGSGGGGGSYEICYYDVWIDSFGNIDWENALPLGCYTYQT